MKILIAYDGSLCADAALDDLRRAGLPPEAEAMVLSVADVWIPPPFPAGESRVVTAFERRVSAVQEQTREQALQAVEEARALAQRACTQIQGYFPDWAVHVEASGDSPAWGILKKADEWQPDLLVVGSHGRSVLGRLVLGSVSQKLLSEAHCTVRVARGRGVEDGILVRLVVGVDGSPDAKAMLQTVAARMWRPGSEARLIAVADKTLHATAAEWMTEHDVDVQAGIRTMVENAAESLRAAGLVVSATVQEGDPKRVLVEEAEHWGADGIFVGARGLRRIQRFLLGSVSAAVATRAQCSVEVVRGR
jgi:nucleotide-binding universal stress UspA family protein